MNEKIYRFNKKTRALHIQGFCHNADNVDCIPYSTEQEAMQAHGKYIHMCVDCEEKKEEILQQAVEKQKSGDM